MYKKSNTIFSIQVAPEPVTSRRSYISEGIRKNDSPKIFYCEFKLLMEVLKNLLGVSSLWILKDRLYFPVVVYML